MSIPQAAPQSCRIRRLWNGRMPRRAMVIGNPRAGRGASLGVLNQMAALLREQRIEVTVSLTAEAGDATRFAEAARDKTDLIVVVGGDGTVNEVLQAVRADRPAVLIVPAGTENVLAKHLGLNRHPRRLMQILREGLAVRFDLGMVHERRFSMLASVGFDAAIVHALHAERSGNITHLSYFWPIWRSFWSYDWPVLSVQADGREVFHGRGMIVIGNISRYALGLEICHEAMPTDGLLDIFVMECADRWEFLKWTLAVATRMHHRLPEAISARARHVRIAAATPIPVEVDGDPAGLLPVDIQVLPAAASLLCARDARPRLIRP